MLQLSKNRVSLCGRGVDVCKSPPPPPSFDTRGPFPMRFFFFGAVISADKSHVYLKDGRWSWSKA